MEELDKTFSPDATEAMLFHKGCTDGFAAAWVAHLRLGTKPVFYSEIAHGDEPPWDHLRDKNVVVVDFSWSRDITLKVKESAKGFVLLDHHASAQNNLRGITGCTIDLDECGATLAWLYYFGMSGDSPSCGRCMPKVLQYVRDRDLWLWAMPESREFNAALYTEVPFDFDEWDGRFFNNPDTLHVIEGNMIEHGLYYCDLKKKLTDNLAKWALERVWRGIPCRVAQVSPRSLVSETGESILRQHPGTRVALCWTYDDWRKKYKVSLRTREGETDASFIAENFGGGGHTAAASFTIDLGGHSIEALFDESS